MKVLVDTSVWSLLLIRKKSDPHPTSRLLAEKIAEGAPLCLTGIIYQEILQGIRSDLQERQLKKYLLDFDFLEETPSMHEKAAELFRQCRKKGLGIGTIDALIASLAIQNECALLTTDKDFERIASIVPLQILQADTK